MERRTENGGKERENGTELVGRPSTGGENGGRGKWGVVI